MNRFLCSGYFLVSIYSNAAANIENVPNFYGMRRDLICIRNGIMPASPSTPQEIAANFEKEDIMREYGMTTGTPQCESTPFFRGVIIEEEFAYCVFASQRIIDEINQLPPENRHYYMDGTFKVVPFGRFNQLLIIYFEFFHKVNINWLTRLTLTVDIFICLISLYLHLFPSMTLKNIIFLSLSLYLQL